VGLGTSTAAAGSGTMQRLFIQRDGATKALAGVQMITTGTIRISYAPGGPVEDDMRDEDFARLAVGFDGTAVLKWLNDRPGAYYSSESLARLGFRSKGEQGTDDDEAYEIKRISYASGILGGWNKGRYYASDKSKGGPETFWEFDFHTMLTHAVSFSTNQPGSPVCSDLEESDDPFKPSVSIVYSQHKRATYLDALDDWCIKHPDSFLNLARPGHRGKSSSSRRLLSLFMRRMESACEQR